MNYFFPWETGFWISVFGNRAIVLYKCTTVHCALLKSYVDFNQDNRDLLNWRRISSPSLLFWELLSHGRRLYGWETSL